MKKISKKAVFAVLKRVVSLAMIVALIVVLQSVAIKPSDDLSYLYEIFVGKKSKYQGIIEIWNIDTFEGGTGSKFSFLEARAKEFEKQNKGLYFLIRNVTEQECLNMLEAGESPDLFSCSYGVAPKLEKYVQPFSKQFDIAKNYLEAGKSQNSQFALAWCRGAYCLISTKANLEKAKVDTNTKVDLISNVLNLGYETQGKKKTYTTYSVSYGTAKYLMPQNALLSYNVNMLETSNKLAFDKSKDSQTPYSAYCSFVAGESVMLLGTQRDIARMENRAVQGKVSDVIYQPLTKYNDLVQFLMLSKTNNNTKLCYMENFAEFLVSEKSQKQLEKIGMFSVVISNVLPYRKGVMFDIASENIESQSVLNLFA